jgi:hypothetical protein
MLNEKKPDTKNIWHDSFMCEVENPATRIHGVRNQRKAILSWVVWMMTRR